MSFLEGADSTDRGGPFYTGVRTACPPFMVAVPGTGCCIDSFEAVIDEMGSAVPAKGRHPATEVSIEAAATACGRAGKAPCPEEAWIEACSGGGSHQFPYGDEYDAGACNGEDAARTPSLAPGGARQACEGGVPGLFDMSGNAMEWVAGADLGRSSTCHLRGGGFTVSGSALSRTSVAVVPCSSPFAVVGAGFRCCAGAPPRP